MNRVLRKRLPRDLRAGWGRYLALILVIAMGIFLVIGVVGSAETVLHGAAEKRDVFNTEDGFFTVFLPLNDDELDTLTKDGTEIQPEFYTDLTVDADTKLRMFKNRESIDKLILDEGRLAEADGECVVEKRYAAVNGLKVGDSITAGGHEFEVTGIGCVPDYDQPKAKFSDTAVQSRYFGLIFVTDECYENVRSGGGLPAEEYVYAYKLGEGVTNDDLKEKIKSVELDYTKVEDKYFREMIDEELSKRYEIEDGMTDLADGSERLADGVSALGIKELTDGAKELHSGITDMQDGMNELLDEVFKVDMENLISFVPRGDNERIESAAGDVVMDKNAGLVAGVIILILFGYVISVFVVHRVESEAPVIGALYSLGVKKKDLLRHYITLPTIVAFFGGAVGTALGFSPIGIGMQLKDSYGYFSLPQYDIYYAPYLLVYGLVLPPVISAIVNALVINKKLSRTALSLIKNEQSASNYRRFSVRAKSFITMFRIRQMVRELRSAITVVFGMLVSLLVVMLGLDCMVMCEAVKRDNVADTDYSYMYLYKYPENEVPKGGESAFVKTLTTDCMGYTLDVTVIGLNEDSRYFDARPEKGRNKAVINNSLAERYGYKKGDRVTFTDSAAEQDYSFTVMDVAQYSPGFTIFMDIDSMRELFGEDEDYFNAVYSAEKLDIDAGRLYSVTSKADIEKSSGVFVEQMGSLISMLLIAGTVIFIVVMYLMMGVMIDRSSFGISLIKIFGYRPKEVRSLYLNGNLTIVSIGALICIPLAKFLMDCIYPSFIPNIACSMVLTFPPYLYVIIYAAVLVIYFVSSAMLTRKLSRITPAEVLKNRE
ncbi:putative ABC transport system permease protein [Ruminococcus sp. YE71]|uniref:FtsX-like permease family protein n=1 Tax=unclassified Ruminococcus TaxID=2608920 RepID=UPI0008890CD7|nr:MULTISPECIES: FtsX-like permease family protein [unclassified Ruminococcus]SDA21870.1 putative ABC transport system permease protein [Ruminococcus sp. YE78]SFW37040.1 putative ABC transport system permease protein [Ruminococcus sp. YE71]